MLVVDRSSRGFQNKEGSSSFMAQARACLFGSCCLLWILGHVRSKKAPETRSGFGRFCTEVPLDDPRSPSGLLIGLYQTFAGIRNLPRTKGLQIQAA